MAKIPRWKWDTDKPPEYTPPRTKKQEYDWKKVKDVIERGKGFGQSLEVIGKIDKRIAQLKGQQDIKSKAKYRFEGRIITGKEVKQIIQSYISELRKAKTETAQYGISSLESIQSILNRKMSAIEYLKVYGRSKEVGFLEETEKLPPSGVQTALMGIATGKTWKTLTPGEKEEYGYRYTPWESIPIGKRKHYYGAGKYFGTLSLVQQQDLISKVLSRGKTITGEPQLTGMWGVKGISGISPLVLAQRGAEFKKAGLTWEQAIQRTTWEAISLPEQVFKTRTFEGLPFWERYQYAGSQNLINATLFPVTLTQMGIKYVRGEGDLLDIGKRIETGKTLTGFDVSKQLQKVSMGPPGLVSAGIGEAITLGKSEAFETMAKYPIESVFATGGELLGLYFGGKLAHGAKVTTIRGLSLARKGISKYTGTLLPGYETFMKYHPINIIRRIYWGAKRRAGLAEYVPEERVWDPFVLIGKKRFAEQPGAIQQMKIFEKTRMITPSKDILSIHTSATKPGIGSLFRIKKGILHETPGLSVSAYGRGSPYFLRVTGTPVSYSTSGVSLFPKIWRPTAPVFQLKNIFRLPSGIRGKGYGITGKYILKQPRGQYGFIAPKVEMGGPEIEAIIRGGTWATRTSKFYYTTYSGVAIPLPRYAIIHGGTPYGFISTKIPSGLKQFVSISTSASTPSIPLIRPGYIGSVLSKPSYPSKPISYISQSYSKSLPRSYSGISSSISQSLSDSFSKSFSKISRASYLSKSISKSISKSYSSSRRSPSVSPSKSYSIISKRVFPSYSYPIAFFYPTKMKKRKYPSYFPFLKPKKRYREHTVATIPQVSKRIMKAMMRGVT